MTDQLINSVLPWPPLGSGICWNGWQNSGNTYLHPVDYKNITKAAPGWRGPLGKVWKDPKHGSFCPPWRCDVPTSQLVDVFANLGALWIPQFRDFFFNGGFIAWLIINSVSSPCLFPGDWGRAGSFKLLVMLCLSGGQCLYCPGVHQELPPYNQRLCYLPGSSQQYRNFCVRPTSPPSVRRCCRGF